MVWWNHGSWIGNWLAMSVMVVVLAAAVIMLRVAGTSARRGDRVRPAIPPVAGMDGEAR